MDSLKDALPLEVARDNYGIGALRAMSTYKGLVCQGDTDDPVELPDAFAAGNGKDEKESIDTEISRITTEAKKNWMSAEGPTTLREVQTKFCDIFRLKLAADPPAKVTPLSIKPIFTARPYRSPQRRYATQQRDFISQTI